MSLLALLLIAAGCTEQEASRASQVNSPSVRPSATGSQDIVEPSDEAMIYAAVVQELVLKDHTFGRGSSPFEHVYIIDGVASGAGDPMSNSLEPAIEPFSEELKKEILNQLGGLPPTEFVGDPDEVRKGHDGMNGVKKNGVILVLGPIKVKSDQKVHVGNSLWCGGLCGQWMTYVLERTNGEWTITGTTGPSAIS